MPASLQHIFTFFIFDAIDAQFSFFSLFTSTRCSAHISLAAHALFFQPPTIPQLQAATVLPIEGGWVAGSLLWEGQFVRAGKNR